MVKFLAATAILFGILAGWVWVQQAYAKFANRHPNLGPYRTEGGGCGSGGCSCSAGRCKGRE